MQRKWEEQEPCHGLEKGPHAPDLGAVATCHAPLPVPLHLQLPTAAAVDCCRVLLLAAAGGCCYYVLLLRAAVVNGCRVLLRRAAARDCCHALLRRGQQVATAGRACCQRADVRRHRLPC